MARTKAVLGAGARLSDYLSASLNEENKPTGSVEFTIPSGKESQGQVYLCSMIFLPLFFLK